MLFYCFFLSNCLSKQRQFKNLLIIQKAVPKLECIIDTIDIFRRYEFVKIKLNKPLFEFIT